MTTTYSVSLATFEAIVARVTGNKDVYVQVFTDASKTETTFLMMALNHKIPTIINS